MAWRFPIDIFFSIVLSKSMCISAFGPSSSPNSFALLLTHLTFFLFLLVANIYSKIVRFFCIQLFVISCHLPPPLVGRIPFRCFEISRFVSIVLPFVDISLIFLLSPVLSGLLPQVVLLFFLV